MPRPPITIPSFPTGTTAQVARLSGDMRKVFDEFASLLEIQCDHPEAQIGINKVEDEMRACCKRMDESLEFTSENQTLIGDAHILFGNLARPEKWTPEDLQLEVDRVRDDVKKLRQKLTDHKKQMKKSRQNVVTTRVELQAAISQVEDDKEEHLDQLKAASSFAALSIWLKQAMGMRIEGLSRWEAAVNHLEMATNLMVQLEQQAGSFVEWWVIMDNTFRAAAGSIQDLNTNRYPKGRMEGLENELGAMKDALLQHQLALVHLQDYYSVLFDERR